MCLLWSTNWVFISQKTTFFIVTAVKTSDHICCLCLRMQIMQFLLVLQFPAFLYFVFRSSLTQIFSVHFVLRHLQSVTQNHWFRWQTKQTPLPLVRKRTIPTERPPPIGGFECQLLWTEGCLGRCRGTPTAVNISFLDRSRYFFFQMAPLLCSQGWVGLFLTHYYAESVVAPEIEPGASDAAAMNSDR
jgi:hypothetical protein